MSNNSAKELLEQALLAQWSHFGNSTEGGLEDDGELVWTESPFRHLPYNAVLKARIGKNAAQRVQSQIERFKQRQVHFMWVVTPSARPENIEQILVDAGLSLITREIGMIAELHNPEEGLAWEYRDVTYIIAENAKDIADFESLTMAYWDLPGEMREYVHAFTWRAFTAGNCGFFFLAYLGSKPVGKAYLSMLGDAGCSSLWAVFVKPEARGLGIGSHLTRLVLQHAQKIGRRKVALMSTEMGRPVYERHGFQTVCQIPVYADTPTLSTLQGVQTPSAAKVVRQ